MRSLGTGIVLLTFAGTALAQAPAGGEFRVNTYTTDRQWIQRPVMEPDGDFFVVWESNNQDGSSYGAFGQRYEASGAPRGGEFRINTYTTGLQGWPRGAVGRRGDFVLVWGSVEDGSGNSIHGRRYDTAGNPIGAEFQVNTFTTGQQSFPSLGRASDGRFVVNWRSEGQDGSDYGIAARRFDASGAGLGSDFLMNTYSTSLQYHSDIAVGPNGDFVGVWADFNGLEGSGAAIFGQRYDASGNRLGGEFQVNSYTTGNQLRTSVSVSPAGGFVVSWGSQFGDGSGYAVMARRFDAAGNALGNDIVVNTYTTGHQDSHVGQQVVHDARGNFIVSWSGPGNGDSFGVFAQRFHASGARRGGEFRVNTYTPGFQMVPTLASDAVGNFVVTWMSGAGQDGSDYGIYAQRFGGLGPAALVVDTLGNRVLEPGEAVDVRPSWRNFNGAAQTFSATLTNITGPPGAVYAITDGAGSYGTVANGATAPCADCYAVSVSNPPARPVTHWDASAVESILPDTQGQQKGWLLHVGRSFTDVSTTSAFYRFIETLLHHLVTVGCSPTAVLPGRLDAQGSRWPCSCSSRRRGWDTPLPRAPRRCSTTSPRAAHSAGGSKSWRAEAW